MREVHQFRIETSNQGTMSMGITDSGFRYWCLELPWRENRNSISCIPAGEYIVKIRKSHKYGEVYWITDVEGRTWILQHSGNVAGDVYKGYKTHSEGCQIFGGKPGYLYGQRAVLNSKTTLRRFMQHMNCETYKLKIYNACPGLG